MVNETNTEREITEDMMGKTIKNARIMNRDEPCGCGCGGKDTWHAKEFKRTIRNVRPTNGILVAKAGGAGLSACEEGTAKIPSVYRPVRVFRWVFPEITATSVRALSTRSWSWEIDVHDYQAARDEEWALECQARKERNG